MRLQLNATQAKKACKKLAAVSCRRLSECQQALAKASGYRDWHDLESTPPPADAPPGVGKEAELIAQLSTALGAPAGDVLHALTASRIVGAIDPDFASALALRSRVFELSEFSEPSDTLVGKVVEIRLERRPNVRAIITSTGVITQVVTDAIDGAPVGNEQIIETEVPQALFIPMRLWAPYGFWTEADGAQVLFSRDYCPMWRMRPGRAPERLSPWLRIQHVDQGYYLERDEFACGGEEVRKASIRRLNDLGIRSTPMLVDTLPLLIKQRCRVMHAIRRLKSACEEKHFQNL
ncbi:hypothetical protein AYJ57_21160 (plasmid) [Salipiger sp. CCB-MM3]|uniref:hypothetical protein n=1 Tax=Salipiger sp. CCB-MM3 TaxID=1792508 RepID=UPI00080A9E06|nr:hypothetical protein [Salipiger sp. CCB-MM3]ANT62988.1 hypothetical protein AYJ57_21160 [Salipiger sp. CCB-MM3]